MLYAQRLAHVRAEVACGAAGTRPTRRPLPAYPGGPPRISTRHAASPRRCRRPSGLLPPGWVALDRRLDCATRLTSSPTANQGPDAELAALLRLLTLEHPPHTDVALRAARAAIEANPECFRAHDALCEVSGVANLHIATTLAPEVLSKSVPRRIAAIPGLPDAARKAAERLDEVAMTRALDDASVPAGDPAEPSWGALAKIVRETRFAFTCRRLDFMSKHVERTDRRLLGGSPAAGGNTPLPSPARIVCYRARQPGFKGFMADLDTTDLGFSSMPLDQAGRDRRTRTRRRHKLNGIVMLLADWTVRDLSMSLDNYCTAAALGRPRREAYWRSARTRPWRWRN